MKNTLTTQDVALAAVARSCGFRVEVEKLPCSPRCAFTFEDTATARELIESYEIGRCLPVPQKRITRAFYELAAECRRLKEGQI